MTIEHTITIPEDHRITFEVPTEIPAGATARFELRWNPNNDVLSDLDSTLEKIWSLCKDSPISVDSFLKTRRHDKELEEAKYLKSFPKKKDVT